jgi:uncharacterized protein YprB with RNaseH-like and TPR domain
MNSFEDKLSKLAALRPRPGFAGHAAKDSNSSNSEELMRLLDGEIRRNRFGCCVSVQRRFMQPKAPALESRVMQLLIPNSKENLCDRDQWLFLDTETTGLSGGTGTYAFMVGLAWWEGAEFVVTQYFMRDYSEERSLLFEISERLAQRRVLVTFNGKSFDWPLLTTRFQMSRLDAGVPALAAHLDLLHPARRLWSVNLRSVALTELERHILKLDRGSDIPSATIPQRYFEFIRGGSASAIAEIFDHNRMDLIGLACLAVHINRILADPEKSCCGGGELFGVSRLLQSLGESQLAEHMYQRSLDEGLPESVEQIAYRELALMTKRSGEYQASRLFWEKLLGDTIEGLKAYEQLAIHYEHHDGQPQKAAMLAREALVKMQEAFRSGRLPAHRYQKLHASFQHRLARLAGKIQDS